MNKLNKKGYTFTEIMVVVALLGIVAAAAPTFFRNIYEFFTASNVRMVIQRDTRAALDIMNRNLRQASAESLILDRLSTSQPPYSRVTFEREGYTGNISYYQNHNKLYMQRDGGGNQVLCENVRYVSFSFPRTDDMSILSVSLTVEKVAERGQKKAIHVAIEKVRIMNE